MTVDVWHVEVQQDDVREHLDAAIDGALGVGDGVHARRPGHPQHELEVLHVGVDVVDDQHAVDGRRILQARHDLRFMIRAQGALKRPRVRVGIVVGGTRLCGECALVVHSRFPHSLRPFAVR